LSADIDFGALGEAAMAEGRFAEAARLFTAAIEAEPWIAAWTERRIDALLAAGDAPLALDLAAGAVAARPDGAAAHRCLARALDAAGRIDEAVAAWREAWSLDADPVAAVGYAEACARAGDHTLAITTLRAAARRHRDVADLPAAEAAAWLALGEGEKVRAAIDRLATLDPAHPRLAALTAAHAALSGDRLTAAFVRGLFDGYADRFDDDLMGRLAYAAPAMIAEAVAAVVGPPQGDRDVIDLGCGTGLSGVALRPFARHLAGVDLSPRMLARASARGLYDRLDVGDLADALAASEGRWDLCVAADVLVYVGALDATMVAVAKALRPSGLFAFTVERGLDADVELGPARRFRHGEAHVRQTASAAGLAVVSLEPCVPRLDRGDPVDGLVAVLRVSR